MYVYLWIIIAIIALVIELLTTVSLTSIWFVVGALFAALASLLKLNFFWQSVIFIVTSIIALLVLRPLISEKLRGNIVPTNSDRVIGRKAYLKSPITKTSWGTLDVLGNEWSCVSYNGDPISSGEKVEILAIDGSKLIVKKI